LILACRVVLRTIFACAANDFTVSHETNSLPGNKMYVARLKKFSLQKYHLAKPVYENSVELRSTLFAGLARRIRLSPILREFPTHND
jgi:hypothetical protein